ncbi:MAG TPA: hypothetical protein PKH67_11175, partial [Rhodocyclaceae bacterium]|nr:hypothetical protein [Rhodocyclaceae bacterium]
MNKPIKNRLLSHRLDRTLGDFAEEWDRLNVRLTGGHPMFDSRFVERLLQHFGQGDEVLVRGSAVDGTPTLMSIVRRE